MVQTPATVNFYVFTMIFNIQIKNRNGAGALVSEGDDPGSDTRSDSLRASHGTRQPCEGKIKNAMIKITLANAATPNNNIARAMG